MGWLAPVALVPCHLVWADPGWMQSVFATLEALLSKANVAALRKA